MSPDVSIGSLIFTKRGEYNPQDIIAFRQGDIIVTHRIIEKMTENGMFYRTRGDANDSMDKILVAEANVLGKKFFEIPQAGGIVLFLKTAPGFLLFIIGPTLLFFLFEFRKLRSEFNRSMKNSRSVIAIYD
jgi:signal peptidase